MGKVEKIDRVPQRILYKQTRTQTGFVSGTEHPVGLKCVFYVLENGDLATSFELTKWHQGHVGYAHGGACYSVMDEIMGRSNMAYNERLGAGYTPVMTGEITCRYVSPAPIHEKLYAYGRVDRAEGRKRFTSGEVVREDGTLVIRCTGIFLEVGFIADDKKREVSVPLEPGDPEFF